MKVTFANVQLHGLGDLLVLDGVEHDPPPPAVASRLKRWLRVRIETDLPTSTDYAEHRARLTQALDTVRANPAGTLVWTDAEGRTEFVNRPAVLAGTHLPEDLNLVGTFEQAIELTFAWEEPVTAQLLTTRFTPVGGAAVALGRVLTFNGGASITRPSEMADVRSRVAGKASLSGKLDADPTLDLASRRTWLAGACVALEAAFSAKAGTLVHGAFLNRVVRPTDFRVTVNQADWCVDWTLDCDYNRFPDESDYLLCDFTLKTREAKADGTLERTLAGTIRATNESAAHTKLNALVATQTGLGYQVGEDDRSAQTVETPDGLTFLVLSFTVTFTQRASATIVRATLSANDAEELAGGTVLRRYSGSVTARSTVNWNTAYVSAVTTAGLLGDNRHVFRLRRTLEIADNQQSMTGSPTSLARVTTGDFLVTVNYTYEYRVKATRFQWEVTAEEQRPRFGERSLAVSGSISAVNRATADLHYAAIKACFLPGGTTNFLREERLSERKEIAPSVGGPPAATFNVVGGHLNVATGEAWADDAAAVLNGVTVPVQKLLSSSGSTFTTYQHFLRLDFGFQVVQPRANNEDISFRYELRIDSDLLRLSKSTTLSGEVFASNWAAGQTALAHLLAGFNVALNFGKLTKNSEGQRREKYIGNNTPGQFLPAGAAAPNADPLATSNEGYYGVMTGYSFSQTYEGRLSSDGAVLECKLSESVRHSGGNVVVQPTAFGNDTFQVCGVGSARRSLRGSVTAATEAVCRAWIDTALATANYGSPTGAALSSPPEITTDWDIEPRTALVARGVSANARLVSVSFSRESYHELLPWSA